VRRSSVKLIADAPIRNTYGKQRVLN